MQVNFKDVDYSYNINTPYQKKVLKKINLEIKKNSFTAIVGKTGSGKSTLLEHINGLRIADKGYVKVSDLVIEHKKKRKDRIELEKKLINKRKDIGILFQFSEQQLFEKTVLQDILFAPLNYGITYEKAVKRAEELIQIMNLPKDCLNNSPFDLSGGEMRKVALCGVLAMNPKILILDEPTIALDHKSKQEFMGLISKLHKDNNITVILVTHNMEYVLEYATNIVILRNGEISYKTNNIVDFCDEIQKNDYNLLLPDIVAFQKKMNQKGVIFSKFHTNYDELLNEIFMKVGNKNV